MTDALRAATRALVEGKIIVYPTDTLYGLGALATRTDATKRLFDLKQLPPERGVSVLFASEDAARAWSHWTPLAQRLAHAFLPGPLTLVVQASGGAPRGIRAYGGSLGVRIVDRAQAVALARVGPITSTSVNKHGGPPATTIDEARALFGREVAAYVDAGRLAGPPSTVVDARGEGPKVLREGAVSEREIEEALALG